MLRIRAQRVGNRTKIPEMNVCDNHASKLRIDGGKRSAPRREPSIRRILRGTDPKNLRVFSDFWLLRGFCGSCGAQVKGRVRRGDFSMVRIRLARFALSRLGLGGSKSGVFCSPLVCRVLGDHRKRQSERSPARAASIALRDHRLPGKVNIEKVGPTYFLNLFRTVVSLCRLALVMVCKHCLREKLPSHLYKSGGNRLR